jgi:hypothetical protein
VFGALARFVGSCDDLTVMMTVPEFGCLQEVQGSFILGDGWSQQRSRPRIVGSQPEWEEQDQVTWVVFTHLWYGTLDEAECTLVTCG